MAIPLSVPALLAAIYGILPSISAEVIRGIMSAPNQAMLQRAVQQVQAEFRQAEQLGRETPEGREHLRRGQHLRNQLLAYQQQMMRQRAAAGGVPGPVNPGAAAPPPQASTPVQTQPPQPHQGPPGMPGLPLTAQQRLAAQQQAQSRAQQLPPIPGGPTAPASMQQAQQSQQTQAGQMNQALQERYRQIEQLRRAQQELDSRLQRLEASVQTHQNPEEAMRMRNAIPLIRQRRDQYQQRERELVQEVRTALARIQARRQATAAPMQGQPPVQTRMPPQPSQAGQQPGTQPQLQSLQQPQQPQPQPAVVDGLTQAQQRSQLGPQQQGVIPQLPGQAPGQAPGQGQPQAQTQAQAQAQAQAQRAGTPRSRASPAPGGLPQSMSVPSHISVPPRTAVVQRPGRPTLTNGGATGAVSMSTPVMTRVPPAAMAAALDPGSERVLSKRKLHEMVAAVMGDDSEPIIDGDVEELLLDLADEFVTSVTGFACRVAKHRKSTSLEAKDIHMHLERNWNMHIPGYSSDEVRSIRRLAPTPSYQHKLQGISTARAINKQT